VLTNATQKRIIFLPFSIPNLAVARCDSGKALRILDTPFLQATTFEHEHEHETPNALAAAL
jgi:hypothetical protein